MGLRTGLFFLFSAMVAAVIGLTVALAVQPGSYMQGDQLPSAVAATASAAAPSRVSLPSKIVRIVPTNPFQANVDRFVDMKRTALNVTGDLAAASVIDEHTPRVPEKVGRAA